jgi:hypothetical protein
MATSKWLRYFQEDVIECGSTLVDEGSAIPDSELMVVLKRNGEKILGGDLAQSRPYVVSYMS